MSGSLKRKFVDEINDEFEILCEDFYYFFTKPNKERVYLPFDQQKIYLEKFVNEGKKIKNINRAIEILVENIWFSSRYFHEYYKEYQIIFEPLLRAFGKIRLSYIMYCCDFKFKKINNNEQDELYVFDLAIENQDIWEGLKSFNYFKQYIEIDNVDDQIKNLFDSLV